jgi:L-lactate dehydrogenase (cytochrome)
MGSGGLIPASFEDYRELARRRLPRVVFDYIDGGAVSETTLRRNTEAMREVALRQRVLRDVSEVKLGVELFGQTLSMPLILAPIGAGGTTARRGETQAARAAEAAGVPFILSTVSCCGLEEVRAAVQSPIWFQLYMIKDRGYMRALLQRAKDAGTRVLVFTVDLPIAGTRYRDVRSGLSGKPTPLGGLRRALDGLSHPGWMWDVWLHGRPLGYGNLTAAMPNAKGSDDFAGWIRSNFDPAITWADIAWVREQWDGPIVIKGVLDVEDAREAARSGVEGLVVSNHGGRQLDGVPASIEALPRIAEAVGGDLTVLMDGGVRSGLDVARALALGAKACLIGRSWVYGLAAGGEAGVAQVLANFRGELITALSLTGCPDVREAGRQLLAE